MAKITCAALAGAAMMTTAALLGCKSYVGATVTCEGTAVTAGQVLAYDRSQNKPGGFALSVNRGTGPEGVCHSIAATASLAQLKTEGEGASIRVYGADVDVLVQGLTGVKVTVTKF